ncbi:alpha/beta hydrolase [Nocardioides cavernae]|uniref:Alpha/beta hydrolase n=1 Tax=Nocardioides cavernae TaxID=1921566 RepID=A0ABR8N4J1_9ACTN|nr:alpha/beta hydrolase [Nocardioides cavernae]MBD3923078.1 alpha/beta hydrolase [Nocardioides cavernae]MBM7512002.1 pimeloyl-ACP methyl ester carboxylesterase [Nocardioides cavernae]
MFRSSRRLLAALGTILVAVLAATLLTSTSQAGAPSAWPPRVAHPDPGSGRPTVVMVHGAWADSSGWYESAEILRSRGLDVIALANPLRGLASDTAYVRSALETIEGPVVVVAHSYGGAVVTGAATGLPNVKALVYVAAFVPDEGEPVGALNELNPGSLINEQALIVRPFSTGTGGGADLYIRPEIFREAFAADLPARTARLMQMTQRPLSAAALGEPSGTPAWRTIPSWYLLATQDRTIPPATQQFMAARAGSTIVRVRSSHVAMQSHPESTAALVLAAARTVR